MEKYSNQKHKKGSPFGNSEPSGMKTWLVELGKEPVRIFQRFLATWWAIPLGQLRPTPSGKFLCHQPCPLPKRS